MVKAHVHKREKCLFFHDWAELLLDELNQAIHEKYPHKEQSLHEMLPHTVQSLHARDLRGVLSAEMILFGRSQLEALKCEFSGDTIFDMSGA